MAAQIEEAVRQNAGLIAEKILDEPSIADDEEADKGDEAPKGKAAGKAAG